MVINKNIPDNVKNLVLEKIEEMKSFNNEYYKQQTYVKTIINYPWPSKKDDIFFKNLSKDEKKTTNYIKTIDNKLIIIFFLFLFVLKNWEKFYYINSDKILVQQS